MIKMISGSFPHYNLIARSGKIWITNKVNEVQINKYTIEKYEIVDTINSTISRITTATKGTNRKSTKSMAGRGIVGGVIFGPVGAIVGAATAKNKHRSVSNGVTTERTAREFKVLVTFIDGKESLLHLDDIGYENFLAATYAEPYETIRESTKKSWIRFFKFVAGLIYLALLVNHTIPVLLLTVIGSGWLIYKRFNKNRKTKKFNDTSM